MKSKLILIFDIFALVLLLFVFVGIRVNDLKNGTQVDSLRSSYNSLVDSLQCAEDAKTQEWNDLIEAIIEVESNGCEYAVGDGGMAVGVLQIRPIVIEELNRFGFNFSLEDRYNRDKSIEIFNAVQSIYNPTHDLHLALKIHNPRSSVAYHRKVISKMK